MAFDRKKLRPGNWNILEKLLVSYCLVALLPMLLLAAYHYYDAHSMLRNNMERDMSVQLDQIVKAIDEKTQGYFAVSSMIYRDSTLLSYLTMDYSTSGYEDLYPYVDNLVSGIQTLYPNIESISFYTSNATLPQDNYYFYYLTVDERIEWYAKTGRGNVLRAGKNEDGTVSFTRLLNLYETGGNLIFLEIRVDLSEFSEILSRVDSQDTAVLTDRDGVIYVSTDPKLDGMSFDAFDLEGQHVLTADTEYCGTLGLYTSVKRLNAQARRSAAGTLIFALICGTLATAVCVYYSTRFKKNVDAVKEGTKRIGSGEFGYRIQEPGGDEIGDIARSVNDLGAEIGWMVEYSYKKELAKKNSDLNLLQEQINPHFLYNALSSISSLAMRNRDTDVSNAAASLSDFYRLTLNKGNRELPIREEIKLLKSYMKIQSIRFGDAVQIEYDLDEDLLDRQIMKLTLQPVVENSIKHGRTGDTDVLHIQVRLFEENGRTVFEVVDDGCGMDAEKLLELQDSLNRGTGGYGLRNVSLRIKMQYGENYGLSIESEPGFGTMIRIELPGEKTDDENEK